MTSREAILPNLAFHDYQPPTADLATEVLTSLQQAQPGLHPKFLYDAQGSQLFERITEQPEYYPFRTEKALLTERAPQLPELVHPDTLIAEPGAGNGDKARLLLDHWQPRGYMPIEISRTQLLEASRGLAQSYPQLPVHAVCADYTRPLQWPEATPPPRLVFFPGSTLGNFEPSERGAFLARLRDLAGPDGSLLLGVDLHKDSATLNAAYNDTAGYTAAFNRNLLAHLNQSLDAGFELDAFTHRAFYNESARRVEMHLDCHRDQHLCINSQTITLPAGSSIHTENSHKFLPGELEDHLHDAGFVLEHWWQAQEPEFALVLARVA